MLIGLQAGKTTLEISLVVLQKIGHSTEDPAIPFLGIYPEDSLICNKDTCSTMKLKKKEDQSVDTSVLIRSNKIPIGVDTEAKYEAQAEGKAIQRLPYLGIHPICSHQTQTLLRMSRKMLADRSLI